MRVVLDTDVIVAAMRSPTGASAELLRLAFENKITLLANVGLAFEYEAVCKRKEHQVASGLSSAEVNVYLDAVIALSTPIETYFLWRPRLKDPQDEMVLEAAVNGRAECIVTFNRKDYTGVMKEFGIDAILPAECLRRIRYD